MNVPRVASTASLLPNGNILIAGGMDDLDCLAPDNVLATTELMLSSKGPQYAVGGSMSVARASHTATVMANGKVLIAGGINGAGTIMNDAEVYDPATNTFASVLGSFMTARYNHTATLLNSGVVLLCGGQTAGGGATPTCNYFTPTNGVEPSGPTCPTAGGCFTGAPTLALPRALHTATLLKDGKVWFAGGWSNDPRVAGTNGWIPTTEKFNPVTQAFGSAASLFEARGYHTATMMGDGKVLIAGGYNGDNLLVNGNNFGILGTLEVYDPVADSMAPANQLTTRRQRHTAVLTADGSVEFFGGLGNITTTYLNAPRLIVTAVDNLTPLTLTDNFAPTLSPAPKGTSTTLASTIAFTNGFLLGTPGPSIPVVGTIVDGSVIFSSPTVDFPDGIARFVNGDPNNAALGLQAPLNGVVVSCKHPGAFANNCGFISETQVMKLQNLDQATLFFYPIPVTSNNGAKASAGTINIAGGGPLTTASGPLGIGPGSNIVVTFNIPMNKALLGGMISSGTLVIGGGSLIQFSSYTATLKGGVVSIPANTPIGGDGFGGAQISLAGVNVTNLSGTLTWAGVNQPGPSISVPASGTDPDPDVTLIGTLWYVATQVALPVNSSFKVDIATVIIRSMVFGDPEYYDESHNLTSMTPPAGTVAVSPTDGRFGHTSVLLPNNDMVAIGGSDCANPGYSSCGPLVAQAYASSFDSRLDYINFPKYNNSQEAGTLTGIGRALHTSTLLPDGTILVAGGTNGPNILGTAEIYDPATKTSVATVSGMREVRDLHTATLLPDGRVLVAGGFTTNAVSSDSTNGSEIYYPDTQFFIPTAFLNTSRRGHTATLMPDGNVMVVGGITTGGALTGTSELYLSTTSVWSTPLASTLPGGQERTQHTATLLKDGRLLVIGGLGAGGALLTNYAFTPGLGWSAVASLPHALYSHTATLLFDGRVLVAGGNDGFGEFNASYIYDPAANTWILTDPVNQAPLLQARFGHTATLLPNDTVLISGGSNRFGVVPTELEMYHVDGSTWAAGGPTLNDRRGFHTMTLGADDFVYAIGGSDGAIGAGNNIVSKVNRTYFTARPDEFTKNAPPSVRQSTITSTSVTPFQIGTNFTVNGLQFRGGTEASGGGAASANSSFSFPHLILQQIGDSGGGSSQSNSGFVVDLTTQIYLNAGNLATEDTSLTVALPATTALLPTGWYNARVGANDLYSNGFFVQAGPPKPIAAPTNVVGTPQGISSMTWTWTPLNGGIANNGVNGSPDGYNVYETTSGVFLATVPQSGSPVYLHTGLVPNSTDQISIAAFTISGDGPQLIAGSGYTFSTAPINVQIASVTDRSLLLEWDPNANTPGTIFEVSESSDAFLTSFSTPVPTSLGLSTNSVAITGLAANTTYYFRLRAFNTQNLPSTFSNYASTETRSSLVTGLTCGPDGSGDTPTSIQWSWTPVSALSYRVYNSSTGVLLSTVLGSNSTFYDTGLGINSQRAIVVSAVTDSGEGPLSLPTTCYTLAAVPAPGLPLMTSTAPTSVGLLWTPNGNPNGTLYKVFFVSYSTTGVPSITTTTVNGFQFNAPGLSPSSYYTASIVALNGVGFPSAPLLAGTTFTLANPQAGLNVRGTTPVSITVDWLANGNSSMTYLQVTYSTDAFATNIATAVAFSQQLAITSTTIKGLLTGTTYWIRVQAENPFGQITGFGSPNIVSTMTFNGGAAPGSLAGVLTALGGSHISGSLGDGTFLTLRSPGGAFPTDTTVTISSYDTSGLPPGLPCPNGIQNAPGGQAMAFSITDDPGWQPVHPLLLTVSYTPAEITGPVSQVSLSRFEPVSGTCVPLQTLFDPTSQTFTAELNHFSLYQLVQIPLATTADSARVFPNPYHAATDGYITIDQIPPQSHVRVMTLRGEKILDVNANDSGLLTWRATNGGGRHLASGLYLIVIESGGSKKILKVAVIR
jgi:hypothetical protein